MSAFGPAKAINRELYIDFRPWLRNGLHSIKLLACSVVLQGTTEMIRRQTLLALLIVAALLPPSTLSADAPPVEPSDISAALNRVVAQGTPGLSVAIGNSCGVIWSGAAGEADVVAHRPMSNMDLLGIGSITKVFVAVVVLQLAEEGKLNLNSTAVDVLGPMVLSGIPNVERATLTQ
jgi:D-alanyl-D-alanine carboxypeptidase